MPIRGYRGLGSKRKAVFGRSAWQSSPRRHRDTEFEQEIPDRNAETQRIEQQWAMPNLDETPVWTLCFRVSVVILSE